MPGVKAHTGKRRQEALRGKPTTEEEATSPPVHASVLTPETQRLPPESDNAPPEGTQGPHVARHRMVVKVALHDRPQPLARGRDGCMAAPPPLRRPRRQLRHQALARRLASDDTGAGLPVPLTARREAQNVERVGLAFAPLFAVRHGGWPKLAQARLLPVELQPERLQAVSQLRPQPRCVCAGLEATHHVIGNANTSNLAWRDFLAPGVHPPIEDIVHVDIREEG